MSVPQTHPTAVVSPQAKLDDGVVIEAYAVVGPHVRIGRGTRVGAHSVIDGRTTIGCDNRIFHHVSVGAVPQDLKFHGEQSELIVGDHNVVREFVTMHIGTEAGGMATRVGSHNLLMNYVHVAHDCTLGDHNIIANGTQLGGHVSLEDHVHVGALVGIHQFARIGAGVMIGAGAMVSQDVAPFCMASGDRARLHGLNLVGLKRLGLDSGVVAELKRAYRIMFRSGLKVAEAAARIRSEISQRPEVERFVRFIETSERGVCR